MYAVATLKRISDFAQAVSRAHDASLSQHLSRSSTIARRFARFIGSSTEEAQLLTIGVSLHDIGKISVSKAILDKPAALTSDERSSVQGHAIAGELLLRPFRLDRRICEIVRHHHENVDGSGYPDGLLGNAIPFLARIARIVDSFAAQIEDRPYHPGISPRSALANLNECSHLYDGALLGDFIKCINSRRVAH